MESKSDEKLNAFTDKLLKDFARETPSFDFTSQVMSKIETMANSQVTEYKPLISKRIWVVLAMLALGVFSFLIFADVQIESSLLSAIQSDISSNLEVFNLPDFEMTNVFLYAVVGFTFFISIQILLLKKHFNRRFV